ncbi:hypothetical protein HaLaN_14781, partial [Haematococcus lacustris]
MKEATRILWRLNMSQMTCLIHNASYTPSQGPQRAQHIHSRPTWGRGPAKTPTPIRTQPSLVHAPKRQIHPLPTVCNYASAPRLTPTTAAEEGGLDGELKALARALTGSLHINDASKPLPPPVWNHLLQGPTPVLKAAVPKCYVTCGSKADVVLCVRFAVAHRLKVYAR